MLVRQVRLPRNQLFVTRVTGRTLLADLLRTVCEEKDLDPRLYELRHPGELLFFIITIHIQPIVEVGWTGVICYRNRLFLVHCVFFFFFSFFFSFESKYLSIPLRLSLE